MIIFSAVFVSNESVALDRACQLQCIDILSHWFVQSFLLRKKLSQPIKFLLSGLILGSILANYSAIIAKRHQYQDTSIDTIEVVGTIVDLPVETNMGRLGVRRSLPLLSKVQSPSSHYEKFWWAGITMKQYWKLGKAGFLKSNPNPYTVLKIPDHLIMQNGCFDKAMMQQRLSKKESCLKKITRFINHINRARSNIADLISENISNLRVEGLVRALTIGDRSLIDFEDSKCFNKREQLISLLYPVFCISVWLHC